MALPILGGTLKEAQVLFRCNDSGCFVSNTNVNNTVCGLHVNGSDVGGFHDAESATFDHCGAGHTDIGILGGNHNIATAEQSGIACEAIARGNAN